MGGLIGVICGSIAAAFLIIGIIIFVVRRKLKEISTTSKISVNEDSSSKGRDNQTECVNKNITELALDDDDMWIL